MRPRSRRSRPRFRSFAELVCGDLGGLARHLVPEPFTLRRNQVRWSESRSWMRKRDVWSPGRTRRCAAVRSARVEGRRRAAIVATQSPSSAKAVFEMKIALPSVGENHHREERNQASAPPTISPSAKYVILTTFATPASCFWVACSRSCTAHTYTSVQNEVVGG